MRLQDIYDEITTSVNAGEANSKAFIKLVTTIFAEKEAAYYEEYMHCVTITALKDAAYKQDISVKDCFNIAYWGYMSLCTWLNSIDVSTNLFLCALCMYIDSKTNIPMFTSVLKDAVNSFNSDYEAASYLFCSIGNVYKALYD